MQNWIAPGAGKGKPQKVKPKCWSKHVTGNESALVGDDECCVGGTMQLHFLCCDNEHEITSLAKHEGSGADSAGWSLPRKQWDKARNCRSKHLSLPLPAQPPSPRPSSWPGHAPSHGADGISVGVYQWSPSGTPGGCMLRSKRPSFCRLHGWPQEWQVKSKNKALDVRACSTVSHEQQTSD